MKTSLRVSLCAYVALMAYLVLVKITLTAFPGVFRSAAQAAVFGWPFLCAWPTLGLAGVALADRTGFPSAWGGSMGVRQRFLAPTLLGIALGVLAIATDAATGWTRIIAAKMQLPSIHIAWPASLLIYPGGAIIVEVAYRILLVPLFLWLVSSILLRGRAQERTFWILAVVTSLIEPLTQDLGGMLHEPQHVTFALVFVQDFVLNFAQAALFRRYGFLSAIWLRVVFYLLWHVLWPGLGM